MINFAKITLICTLASLLVNCSQVLQTVNLEINTEDSSHQEDFSVVGKTLTLGEARKQNNSPINELFY